MTLPPVNIGSYSEYLQRTCLVVLTCNSFFFFFFKRFACLLPLLSLWVKYEITAQNNKSHFPPVRCENVERKNIFFLWDKIILHFDLEA